MEWKVHRRPREEGTGETPQRSEEAHEPHAGKRSAWNGNQYCLIFLTSKKSPPLFKRVSFCWNGLISLAWFLLGKANPILPSLQRFLCG
ncbi:hypothetical protein FZC76_11400 [Sutcliffiella horikoshii]|uniref:Uncharacterized protein n=1 Tax=Sutcliffiella horikoshii TaxID=79883 RepID=A0A5D4T045_9BACI|nr:hypothetical protein FZC76_11400 [Sutcliffiella horikoshii]